MDGNQDTKKCPYCGEEININAKKCKHCKEFLPEDISPNGTIKCPYCGDEINANAKKCKHCGEWLVENEVKTPTKVQTSKRCQFCGCIIPESAERCPKCGEWLVREENGRHEKGNGYIVSIIAWVIGLLICLGIVESGSEQDIGAGIVMGIVFAIVIEVYLLPTRIALDKRHTQLFLVTAVNVLLGYTLIGWLVALAIASMQRSGRNSL